MDLRDRMTLYDAMATGRTLHDLMDEKSARPWDFAIAQVADMEHIEVACSKDRLARLRERWDPAQITPLQIAIGDRSRAILLNGQHRLTLAREFGMQELPVMLACKGRRWDFTRHRPLDNYPYEP